jgi:hypothetical protein
MALHFSPGISDTDSVLILGQPAVSVVNGLNPNSAVANQFRAEPGRTGSGEDS